MRWLFCLFAALAWLSAACSRLDPPQAAGELVVAIRGDPVFYEPETEDGPATGFEHDVVAAFAEELKVKVRFVPVRTSREMRELLRDGKIHFAAALPVDDAKEYRFTQPLHIARELIVQQADTIALDTPQRLAGHTIEVVPDSPLDAALRAMTPPVTIAEVDEANDIDLLADVADGKAELAATDAAHFDVAVNFYPDIVIAQELPGTVAYAWAFRSENEDLRRKADAFIARIQADGTLARIHDRYYGHIKRIDPDNMAQFLAAMQTRLPHFRADFQQAQLLTGLDWRLLAALSYQESAWDPLATSPTGVRGIMMLTEDTADYLHVSNRLDAHESILAGARYLDGILDAIPDGAPEPDRTWLALAAYNLGLGHFNGARAIAKGLKLDPDSWYDMKKVLPLMARPDYYKRLKSGRARGGEAVIMVENVRNFYNVLTRFEKPYVAAARSAGLNPSTPPAQGLKAPRTTPVPSAFW
ncbi:MAG: membrane-bound lytic murein transglycosylase MltF [Rhodocyclaceae bacterium]|nr:membrane-bound lytic murein transglycosylase MltF [Rhodocyclaceae bacterium]